MKHAQHFIEITFQQLLHFGFSLSLGDIMLCSLEDTALTWGIHQHSQSGSGTSSALTVTVPPCTTENWKDLWASCDQAISGQSYQDLQQCKTSLNHTSLHFWILFGVSPHVPAWLTGSGAALLLSGLEETSLCRTMRPHRDSMDFILGVNEWYRAPQSLAILTAYTADAQNLLPNPPSLLAQQKRSTQKTRF